MNNRNNDKANENLYKLVYVATTSTSLLFFLVKSD